MSVSVQDQDFSLADEVRALQSGRTDIGALVTFTGTVRDLTGDLQALELEHYPGMTRRELEAIEREARDRFSLTATRVIHRYGRLTPGDNIVLVITAAAHRQAAFEGAMFLMDWLKTKAPFWKREIKGGEGAWVDARETDNDATDRWHK